MGFMIKIILPKPDMGKLLKGGLIKLKKYLSGPKKKN